MTRMNPSVGETLRRLRTERDLSLAGVAGRAGVSVATLSRVETNKQGLEVDLLLRLAAILGVSAAEILGEGVPEAGSPPRRISELPVPERAKLLFSSTRPRNRKELDSTLDGLVSTVEVLRAELVAVQHALGPRRKRRTRR